jgi:hypothetical protein
MKRGVIRKAGFMAILFLTSTTQPKICAAAYREAISLTPQLVRQALDPALMCLANYKGCQVFGWNGPALKIRDRDLVDEATGLDAGIYERTERGIRQFVLCFRGVQTATDWKASFDQALGDVPEQYRQAAVLAQIAVLYAGDVGENPKGQLTLCGHSLGAGLASFSGLMWQKTAFCFATAPLGGGSQRQLRLIGEERLRNAPSYVTHFFIKGDRVPQSAAIFGAHFGRIVEPGLQPPANFSGVQNETARVSLLSLAGLNSHSALTRTGTLARSALDSWARHTMENYVGALVAHLPAAAGFSPVGKWSSTGSFFQVSSNTATFTLTANGRMLLTNEMTILGDKIRIGDSGWWEFSGQTLTLGVGDLLSLSYGLVAFDGTRVVQWRRSEIEPNLPGLRTSFERSGATHASEAATTAAVLLRGASKLMKNKTVTWTKTAELNTSEGTQ